MAGLSLFFFRAQVFRLSPYALTADTNRLQRLPIPAPRGTIYGRDGEVLAGSVPSHQLWLLPVPGRSARRTLERLAPLLGLPPERVDALVASRRAAPARPLVVATRLTSDERRAIAERRGRLPGVIIQRGARRHYPAGAAAAHAVGYVGPASSGQRPSTRRVGKTGLERQYDEVLRGRPGMRFVEIDRHGRILGEPMPALGVAPVPGRDVRVSLDLDLQRRVAAIVPGSFGAAVVALEPASGRVLALYSSPAYDPNALVRAAQLGRQVPPADSARALLDRAVARRYSPGAVWQPATAAIALGLDIVDPRAYLPIPCRGGMRYGDRYFRCWKRKGHGYLTLPEAIERSCHVYFYQLALKIGLERLLLEGTRLGFGRRSGLDLPAEAPGRFPGGPGWYREHSGRRPGPAAALALAIGRGPNAQTVLGMARFYAALAAGGRLPEPRLASAGAPADGRAELRLSDEALRWLREGLRRAASHGTTAVASERWVLAGKAASSPGMGREGRAHTWFVGMAGPKEGEAEIVVAALVEGEHQESLAARYAAEIADYYLRMKHGMPIDTMETSRAPLIAGTPATRIE